MNRGRADDSQMDGRAERSKNAEQPLKGVARRRYRNHKTLRIRFIDLDRAITFVRSAPLS